MKNKQLATKIIISLALIVAAISWRVINFNYHFAPNLEIVTAVSLIAAIAFGMRYGLLVALSTMVLSDLIIGNTAIFYFTWASFAIIGLSGAILGKLNNRPVKQIVSSIGFAIISSFVFFLVTNFGVWAQGWYPASINGLIECYTLAIPFYRTMLIGNLMIIPIAVSVYQIVINRHKIAKLVVNSLISK